jgi:hypothetical protein
VVIDRFWPISDADPIKRDRRCIASERTTSDPSLPFVKDRFAVAHETLLMSGISKTQGDGGRRSLTTLHLPEVDVVPPPPEKI